MFQIRLKEGLLDYPSGKSAMVYYGAGEDMGQSFATLTIQEKEDYLCRHMDTNASDPFAQLKVFEERFLRRFGQKPSWPK